MCPLMSDCEHSPAYQCSGAWFCLFPVFAVHVGNHMRILLGAWDFLGWIWGRKLVNLLGEKPSLGNRGTAEMV